MMNLKKVLTAAAFATALPFAASAATITINGTSETLDLGTTYALDVFETADVNVTFLDGDTGGTLKFLLENNSDTLAAVTLVGGTIDQDEQGDPTIYGFAGGISVWFDGDESVVGEGEKFAINYQTTINPEGSVMFEFEYGDPFGVGNLGPDIDFTVFATPVPVPAAGFLLLGGLGGLAMMRRRKKS